MDYPYLARLITSCETKPMTNGGIVVKTKKHRPYRIRLVDWARTLKFMLDIEKIPELDEETKLKIKTILEETVLPYMKKLKE